MEKEKIWLASPTMHGEELGFVHEAFEQNWIAPLGVNVDGFEQEIARYLGVRHGAALTSGTAAIHLAVRLAGVKPGDVVLCSDLTFAATLNPVSYEGGVQVLIDSERESWNMDPAALEVGLKKYGDRVKAVIVVNLYGVPARLKELRGLCDTYGVVMIEDAAESLGAACRGRRTGTFGQYGVISFNGNKIITTSGGGMLLSDDGEAVEKARFWATQARDRAPWYQHSEIGYNDRMSNVVAGIGRGQLLHLEEHIALKKAIYHRYETGVEGLPVTMNPWRADSEPNFWLSCITIDRAAMDAVTPETLRLALEGENIEARPIWKPMHLQPVFADRDYITVDGDVAGDLFARGLCLPSDIKMTVQQQERVIQVIRRCFGEKV